MNRVVIIILNWNGIDDTISCLNSLQKQSEKNYSILVVDNGSSDDSKEILEKYRKKHKNTKIIFNKKNYGFAGGVNIGIKWAIKNNFEYFALFNNDAIADSMWLQGLINAIKPNNVGISTGLLLRRDGKTIDTTGDWYSIWGLPFPRNRNDLTKKAPIESELVFGATGGASLYKTKLIQDIGLFDEDFFAYYEDVDISFRAQLAGWKVVYTPQAIAYHEQGATSNKISGFAVYQTFKNLPLLFTKNVPDGLRLKIGHRFYFAYLMFFLNAIKNKNGKHAFKGFLKSLKLHSIAKINRADIQSNKKVNNKYIESILWPDLPPDQTGIQKLRNYFIRK